MLKRAVLFTAAFCLVQSQRPWHAGSNRLPQVLPQYLDERIAAEQAAQAAQAAQPGQTAQAVPGQVDQGFQAIPAGQPTPTTGQATGQVDQGFQRPQGAPTVSTAGAAQSNIGNRLGVGDGASATAPSTINPLDLPVDAHGDVDLVNRIMSWPREKWPFWFINWQAIQAHRGDANNPAQPVQTQPNTRSFFAG